VKLASFLSDIQGVSSCQTKKLVAGPGPTQWKLAARGRALVEDRDWSRRSGRRGGGACGGNAPIHVKEECLEEVLKNYYFNCQIKE